MKKMVLRFFGATLIASSYITQVHACDDASRLCISSCANELSPERCMQLCQDSRDRCARSGVFKMPIGISLSSGWRDQFTGTEPEAPRPLTKKGRVPQ